jgi:hypothetical protein
MKKSTLFFAVAVLAVSSNMCLAQQPEERTAVPMPIPLVPTLKCCTCVAGVPVTPPPLDISTGQVAWTVNPGGQANAITSPNSGWATLSPAKWVQVANSPSPASAGPGPFHYATSFGVPKCPIPFSSVNLTGTYAADNGATVTLSPNTSTCSGALANPYCFKSPGMPLNFPVSLTTPLQTLNVDVTNQPGSISGLIVNARVVPRCSACPKPYVNIDNLPMQGGNEHTQCPALNQTFTRAQILSSPATAYVQIMLANLDQRCASAGAGFKLQQITFLKCAPDPRGVGFGPNATANISCGP